MEELKDVQLMEEDTQEGQFLTFSLAEQEYGIEIRHVTEIIGIQRITDLPETPEYVKGVINLRGKVIPVIDVRLRFRMPERDYDERTCIVVVNISDTSVGLVVDTVSEVINIPADNIEPAPKVNQGRPAQQFVQGLAKVGEQVKILLDTQRLLFDEEFELIKATATATA